MLVRATGGHPSRTARSASEAIPQIAGFLIHKLATTPAFCGSTNDRQGESSSVARLMQRLACRPRLSPVALAPVILTLEGNPAG